MGHVIITLIPRLSSKYKKNGHGKIQSKIRDLQMSASRYSDALLKNNNDAQIRSNFVQIRTGYLQNNNLHLIQFMLRFLSQVSCQ
jgi:hypothetical protein